MQDSFTDNQLLSRIAAGDAHAFRTLVIRHAARSHSIARRMLASPGDAEEAVQDAFTKVWTHAASFRSERAAFSTWFYSIISNSCRDLARKRPPPGVAIEDVADLLPDTAQGPEAAQVAAQEGWQVRQAMDSLPGRQRMAVILCYFENMTNPEAAAAMGLHVKAVEGLLVRARKKLRVTLSGG